MSEVHRRVLIEYVRPLLQGRLVCTSAKMRARVAARLGDEGRQLRELFSRLVRHPPPATPASPAPSHCCPAPVGAARGGAEGAGGRQDSASPWLDSVVPRLRELLVLEDTAALQMEVAVLVRDFPDVRWVLAPRQWHRGGGGGGAWAGGTAGFQWGWERGGTWHPRNGSGVTRVTTGTRARCQVSPEG